MFKTVLNNFTHFEIHAEIEPLSLQGKKMKIIFPPRDKKAFKLHDEDYSVLITKIDFKPDSLFYKLRFSSYMAFMCDIDSDKIFLRNFRNRSVVFSGDDISALCLTLDNNKKYDFTTTTNTTSTLDNSNPVTFQTKTSTFNYIPEVKEKKLFTLNNYQTA
jgi:hypothetical protein